METAQPNPIVAYTFVAGAICCMAPTAVALAGSVFLGLVDLAAYDAVHNQGEDPYLLGFTLIFTLIAAIFGGGALALIGLVLHTLGLVLAVLAFRAKHRLAGGLLGLMHVSMLVVDIVFLGGWALLVVLG